MDSAVAVALISTAGLIAVALIQRNHGKVLKSIDGAVNHRQPGEPRLIDLVVDAHAQVGEMRGELRAHVNDDVKHPPAA